MKSINGSSEVILVLSALFCLGELFLIVPHYSIEMAFQRLIDISAEVGIVSMLIELRFDAEHILLPSILLMLSVFAIFNLRHRNRRWHNYLVYFGFIISLIHMTLWVYLEREISLIVIPGFCFLVVSHHLVSSGRQV